MRAALLVPFAVALAVAGCESDETQSSTPRQRDLTVRTVAHEVKVASPLELRQIRTRPESARQLHRAAATRPVAPRLATRPKPNPTAVAHVPTSSPSPAAAAAEIEETPANDRELPPGKTVTVIPTSSGPSTATDWSDEGSAATGRTMIRGGGGTCRPGRRPGIGIAAIPRPRLK
jgi:hypothetical protein